MVNSKTEQEQKLKNIFIVYAVLIIVLAVIPIGNSDVLTHTSIISFRADHILHAMLFIPWGFFSIKIRKDLPLWFLWGLLYAAISEGIQYFIPYRSCNVSDMIANMIGVGIGFIIFISIRKTVLSN